jgi:hypothetical protein
MRARARVKQPLAIQKTPASILRNSVNQRRKRQMRLRAGALKVAAILWTRLTKEQAQRRAASTAGMVKLHVQLRHL